MDWVLEFVQEKRFSNATPRHLNVASIAIQKRLSKLRLNRHGDFIMPSWDLVKGR